jgi:DNA-binding transcriptional ArsR family regulator
LVKKKRPWSLLSSHGLTLVTIARFGDLAVPEICDKTGLSRSTILHALKDLRRARMLRVRRVGRRNQYEIDPSANMRHPIARDTELGDLLKAFSRVPHRDR